MRRHWLAWSAAGLAVAFLSVPQLIALGPEQHPVLEAIAPWVASGEQTVTGRRATGGRCVGIGEADSHAGQPVHLWSMELGIVGIAREVLIGGGVPHPHVVRHHQYDVGAFGGEKPAEAKGDGKKGEEGSFHEGEGIGKVVYGSAFVGGGKAFPVSVESLP